jgi:HSP20 family protein
MAIKDLIPWKGSEKKVPVRYDVDNTFEGLRRSFDRYFDDFWRGFELTPFEKSWSDFSPNIDVVEGDKEIKVTAELPGLDENDIQVSLDRDLLTISGEKKTEQEDKGKNYYRMERSYGSFRRTVSLPCEVEADKVEAAFKQGVLTVTLPKSAEVLKHTKKIKIKSA